MADIHITKELLDAVVRGELPARVLVDLVWNHLTSLCPVCRQEFEVWQRSKAHSFDYEAAFRVLPAILERQAHDLEQKNAAATCDFRELLKLSHSSRLERIEKAVTRFRGPVLARLLLDEAKISIPTAPQRVYELAEAAQAVLLRSPGRPGVNGLLVRAAAYLGNSLRSRGDLEGAEERLGFARHVLRRHGVTDLPTYAELDWFEGTLRKDQHRFPEAEELLIRSVGLYELAGDPAATPPLLLSLGLLYHDWRRFQDALQVFRKALQKLEPEIQPRLYCYARHNLVMTLCSLGEYQAAAEALNADRELYRGLPDSYTQSRVNWLEGKIAAGLGRLEEAERTFLVLREHFLAQGNDYDAAMVSQDLALVHRHRIVLST